MPTTKKRYRCAKCGRRLIRSRLDPWSERYSIEIKWTCKNQDKNGKCPKIIGQNQKKPPINKKRT